jgi:hypothetical protein
MQVLNCVGTHLDTWTHIYVALHWVMLSVYRRFLLNTRGECREIWQLDNIWRMGMKSRHHFLFPICARKGAMKFGRNFSPQYSVKETIQKARENETRRWEGKRARSRRWSEATDSNSVTQTRPLDGVADSYWQLHDVLHSPSIDNGSWCRG